MLRSADSAKKARSLSRRNHGRPATVYDAVAGRISNDRFIQDTAYIPSTRDTASTSNVPVPPEEILCRNVKAPVLYEESNIYDQDHNLGQNALPDSDILKALHAYSSDFYAITCGEDAEMSYRSFDASALVAFGIVIEEMCRAGLGETGHLALVEEEGVYSTESDFTETEDESYTSTDEDSHRNKKRKLRQSESEHGSHSAPTGSA